MTLIKHPARVEFFAFLVSLGALVTVILVLITWISSGTWSLGVWLGVVCLFALIFAERIVPNRIWALYDNWNAVGNRSANILQAWLTWSMYYIVFCSVRRFGATAADPDRASDTTWMESRSGHDERDGDPSLGGFQSVGAGRGWMGEFFRWACSSKNGWMVSIIPLLLLLRWTRPVSSGSIPTNVYTLY